MCHISLERRLQLFFKSQLNWRSAQKIMGFQSRRSPNFKNFGTLKLGVLGQNDIWVQALWPGIYNPVKGKVVASPKSRLWWVYKFMYACGLFVHQKCFNYALTNLLFGLCRSMWIIYSLVIHPSPHLWALACPSIHEMLQTKECTPTPYPFAIFTFRLAIEFIKEFGGASKKVKTVSFLNAIVNVLWISLKWRMSFLSTMHTSYDSLGVLWFTHYHQSPISSLNILKCEYNLQLTI